MKNYVEVNIDSLVGPTHHFGGLSFGNIASMEHKNATSSPKKAALECLNKIEFLVHNGVPQYLFPPHIRPCMPFLRSIGYLGNNQEILQSVYRDNKALLLSMSSQSAMWMANAATYTPSCDSNDNTIHITPANLITHLHRFIEQDVTYVLLKKLFLHVPNAIIHKMLPPHVHFADEGAANHIRFCEESCEKGLHLYVYGSSLKMNQEHNKFPARQTHDSVLSHTRTHKLSSEQFVIAEQNPKAIDLGVFHNDVIATGYKNSFLVHEHAYVDQIFVVENMYKKAKALGFTLNIRVVKESELSLKNAVASYLFNSQIVTTRDNNTVIIAPYECKTNEQASQFLKKLLQEKFFNASTVEFVPLSQSMNNGGGPACMRLRMLLNRQEIAQLNNAFLATPQKIEQLKTFIQTNYPDTFHIEDFLDPTFIHHLHTVHTFLYHQFDMDIIV